MDKSAILQAIIEQLRADFEHRQNISRKTRAAGNDSESKAENKYDTLSTEENYLADGLARQALAAAEAASALEKLRLESFGVSDPIDLGALVQVEFPDRTCEWFLLAPAAGGTEIEHEGETIVVLTPESPLGAALIGRLAGDSTPQPKARIVTVQ
jgi:transcription elongation GreA/GreB family factor